MLAVVPTYLAGPDDADLVLRCLVSLWTHGGGADVVVVDDASPDRHLLDGLRAVTAELGYDLLEREERGGRAAAVNAGLRVALATGRDALLMDADAELVDADCLALMLARTDTAGRPAAVVGARLIDAHGCIQHAGRFLSALDHRWWDRFRHAPANLPEALEPTRCPVGGALQLIRHETLAAVGLYDEALRVAVDDVDYCLRVFASGRECIYEPAAVARHAERTGLFNPEVGALTDAAYAHLGRTWAGAGLEAFTVGGL